MSASAAVRRAVPVLAQYGGHIDHGILRVWLIRAGLSQAETSAAIRFIPLAFGRALLDGSGVQLPETYVRVSGDTREEQKLVDEPFFVEAAKLTKAFAPDVFTAVAMQSSELQAVNNALNAGSQPQDLILGATMIEWDEHLAKAAAKPWWKVW